MQEDRRAHARLDSVETLIRNHSSDIIEMKISLQANTLATEANTLATKTIEANTSEIVNIMKGAKGATTLVWFLAKLFGALTIIMGAIAGAWYVFIQYIQDSIK